MCAEQKIDHQKIKKLRETRKDIIEKAKKNIKTQSSEIKKIKELLQSGAKTVPEIATAAQMQTSLVLQYITGLRKYGIVAEGTKEGDYFKYELAG